MNSVNHSTSFVVLIPAYEPTQSLVEIVDSLRNQDIPVVIVNDGSKEKASLQVIDHLTQHQNITILHHAVNLGKGAALKTGLNHIYLEFSKCAAVVTADADGQHSPKDIIRVGEKSVESRDSLIMGVREFKKNIPLRSLIGNKLTYFVLRLMTGINIKDTQTGLRGIPLSLIGLFLRSKENGYSYEMEMILKCKDNNINIQSINIETIYLNNNDSSHFNPFWDSMKIYFVLMRFSFSSFITMLADYIIFTVYVSLGGSLAGALISGRIVAGNINFLVNQKYVFHGAKKQLLKKLSLYWLLVIFSGIAVFFTINTLTELTGWNVLVVKALAELFMFFINFVVQRDLIFIPVKSFK